MGNLYDNKEKIANKLVDTVFDLDYLSNTPLLDERQKKIITTAYELLYLVYEEVKEVQGNHD